MPNLPANLEAVKSESVRKPVKSDGLAYLLSKAVKSVFLAKVVLPSNAVSTAFWITFEPAIAFVITSSSICATSPFFANLFARVASNASAVMSEDLAKPVKSDGLAYVVPSFSDSTVAVKSESLT